MASFYAELHVGSVRIPLLSFRYEATQATDERGRVNAKVRKNLVYGTCHVPVEDPLGAWATSPHKRQAADVVLYDADGGQALETLSMAGAYCFGYCEWFESGNTQQGAYTAAFTLSDPDGWTIQRGGPGALVLASAGEHGVPPAATEVEAAAASLETKRQRYKMRQKMLADSGAKLKRQMDQQMAGIPRPSLAMPTEAGSPVPLLPLLKLKGPNLSPVIAAHDRFTLNNIGVEMAKLSDDTYFNDVLPDASGKLNPVHFLDHNPDGTFLLNNPPEGWLAKQVFKGGKSGFMAILYESTYMDAPMNVLAFRGTDADPSFMQELKKDGGSDYLQGTGRETVSFAQVEEITKKVKRLLGGKPFTAVGHSLGGAQASFSSLLAGTDAYTFNSAGLHVNSLKRAGIDPATLAAGEKRIQAFYADNDPLSFYQNRSAATKLGAQIVTDGVLRGVSPVVPLPNPLTPVLSDPNSLPPAVGVRHLIPSGSTARYKGADKDGHSVAPMVRVIEEQKTTDSATLQKYLATPD